jgi:hypothetical protein
MEGAFRTTGIGIPIAPPGDCSLERALFPVNLRPEFANRGAFALVSQSALLLVIGSS